MQECCWDLLELPMTQSSVKVKFISTCPPDDRVFIAKDDTLLANTDPDSEDIKVAGNIEKYAKCPKQLEYWCLADFVSNLEIRSKLTKETAHMEEVGEIDDINIDASNLNNDFFPMHLRNTIIHKHKVPKVICFINYKYKLDIENYCRERLLLYTPWRHEETDLYYGKETYIEAFEVQRQCIENKMKIYKPMAAKLTEALDIFQQENSLNYDDIAPSTQHEELEHTEFPTTISTTFEYCDPEWPVSHQQVDIGPHLQFCAPTFEYSVQIIADKMSDDAYRKLICSLNKHQYEFFTHIMHMASTKADQVTCCLHGGAGTGKSHVLKALYQGLYHTVCMKAGQNRDNCRILVMAPIGKAAYNVKGSTIHAALHIPANTPLHEYKPLSYDMLNTYRMKYQGLEWILCDEISMVSNEAWKYVNLRLQDILQNKLPFGGVNIIAIGDLFQLQPVKSNFIFMDLKHDYGPLATNLWCEYFV